MSQDLDRHFERLPLLVQGRYLQFDPCHRGDLSGVHDWRLDWCGQVSNVNWVVAFLILSLVCSYSHYLFASQKAHVGAIYAGFLFVAVVAVGTPLYWPRWSSAFLVLVLGALGFRDRKETDVLQLIVLLV